MCSFTYALLLDHPIKIIQFAYRSILSKKKKRHAPKHTFQTLSPKDQMMTEQM